ncbi:MAG: hypothetical protein IT290_01430 [Deltaproteobacteria bacterium]|nr:hypothetical protein [Deltaproteobacteria bacterium]
MKLRSAFIVCGMLVASTSFATPSRFNVTGRIVGGSGYSVNLLTPNGDVRSALANGRGAFTLRNVPASAVRGASLQLVGADGSYFGPVVLKKARSKAFLHLSGKLPDDARALNLGTINLKTGHALARTAPVTPIVNTRKVTRASTDGVPIGAGRSGLISTSSVTVGGVQTGRATTDPGEDLDRDGIPSTFDVDDDGDTILDAFDESSVETTAADVPFTALFLSLADTLNYNIDPSLSRTAIDAVVGGANQFSLTFFFSNPPGGPNVNGGHVVCPNSLTYCARDTGTAIYAGVSESDPTLRGLVWSTINTNGSGYPNLESTTIGGRPVLLASIQPRIGTSNFRPGDVYTVAFTSGGTVAATRTMSLPPYFVTVPALKTFNAGFGDVNIDYADTNSVGMSPGNAIELSGSNTLRMTYYRPQRLGISGAETSEYVDMGHLHYGLLASGDNITSEFTCAGLYSGLSSTLTEDPAGLGTGGSPSPQDGAILWPLTDSAGDATPSPTSTMSFTVDLRQCMTRAGITPDPTAAYRIVLTAAGEDLAGGANRAAQTIYVRLP